MKRNSLAVGLALVGIFMVMGVGNATAANTPLPAVPKIVSELYLPQEQGAAGAAYRIYSGLPAAEIDKLFAGGRVAIDAPKLSPQMRGIYAAWHNSARWGCDPPAEEMNADSIAQSQLVLAGKGGIVDLCLQSPQKKIWKRLTIACSSEKAQWVRAGLPLVPSWFMVPWKGGPMPPPSEYVWQYNAQSAYFRVGKYYRESQYRTLRGAYGVYAGLPSDSLRKLHREHELTIKFQDLPPADRQRLAEAFDQEVLRTNKQWGTPLDLGRPPQLRKLLYGITKVRLVYAYSDPSCKYAWPQGGDGFQSFPRPYRVVFLHIDPLVTEDHRPGVAKNPPLSHFNRFYETTYLIAWPTEIQQRVMSWIRALDDYRIRWQVFDPDSHQLATLPGAPPPPDWNVGHYLRNQVR